MERFPVECLRCGAQHELVRLPSGRVHERPCPRCDYLGWAGCTELNEHTRRALRERAVSARRLRVV